MTQSGTPPIVDWLVSRSYGHSGSVTVPDSVEDTGLMGPFPSGVEDVIGHLAGLYGAGRPADGDHWAFLIGAPGNGKSEALRGLARALGVALPRRKPGAEAPRSYDCVLPGQDVHARLVNDASIRRRGRHAGRSLVQDVVEAVAAAEDNGFLLFANVNRGILVEEAAVGDGPAPDADTHEGIAAAMVSWLDQVASGEGAGVPSSAFYGHRTFDAGRTRIHVHAVVLDCTSVFEPRPGRGGADITFDAAGLGSPRPYRPVGGIEGDRSGSVAAALLEQVLSEERWEGAGCCSACPASSTCPFVANVRWLRDPGLAAGFLGLGRAAEVASGRRMTYRDLLGHVALSLVGRPEAEWLAGMPACDWVRSMSAQLPGTARAAGGLASHRVYASLFPPPNPDALTWRPGAGPISQATLTPVVVGAFGKAEQGARAATFAPAYGMLDPCKSVDGWEGRRFATLDAAEAMHVEAPTAGLETSGVLPAAAVSKVEEALDLALLTALGAIDGGPTQKHRQSQAHAWRTILLLRQVGLASGAFADRKAVDAWLYAQSATLLGTGQTTLSKGLGHMLVPHQGSLVLAPYRPRTRAFDGTLPPRTAFHRHSYDDLRVELKAVKDGFQAILRFGSEGPGSRLVPVPVDLDLAREALVASTAGGGFTDLPDRTLARVERARASLMSHGRSSSTAAALHVTDGAGRLFKVSGEPGNVTLQEAQL